MTTLHLGDCLTVLTKIADNSIDAVVTDPPYGLSIAGMKWDYDVPSVEVWTEVLRVLKPGGYLLSFGGSRTVHRMTVNIEDAGFEIRDTIMWLYGQGFPHGANLGLIEKKKAGTTNWDDWNTTLKPAYEPIIMARKPIPGTVYDNVMTYGTGAINIGACRIPTDKMPTSYGHYSSKPERINKDVESTDCAASIRWNSGRKTLDASTYQPKSGRYPANIILDEEAGAVLDEQSGFSKSSDAPRNNKQEDTQRAISGLGIQSRGLKPCVGYGHKDEGGASRFFYCAKASLKEKGEDNTHPTVKPLALMQYIIKLVVPKGATVLDPYMGSGTTGVAAIHEGMSFVGIEMDPIHLEYATSRIEDAVAEVIQPKEST